MGHRPLRLHVGRRAYLRCRSGGGKLSRKLPRGLRHLRKGGFCPTEETRGRAAALSVELADLSEKIGPRLTHDQIEQTMRETNSVDMLKADGIWDDWVSGRRGRQK